MLLGEILSRFHGRFHSESCHVIQPLGNTPCFSMFLLITQNSMSKHNSPEGENDHDVQYLTMKEFDFTHAEHNGLAAHKLTTLPKVSCANGVMVSAEDSEATDLSSNLGGILFFWHCGNDQNFHKLTKMGCECT